MPEDPKYSHGNCYFTPSKPTVEFVKASWLMLKLPSASVLLTQGKISAVRLIKVLIKCTF